MNNHQSESDAAIEKMMRDAEQDRINGKKLGWKTFCPKCDKQQYVKKCVDFDYACHKCDLGFNVEVNCQADYKDVSYTHIWEDGTEDYQPSESDKYMGGW